MIQDPNAVELSDMELALQESIPNLDGFLTPEALHRTRAQLKRLLPVIQNLASYCEAKAHAMQMRLDGRISDAMRFEAAADTLYGRLPEWAKW